MPETNATADSEFDIIIDPSRLQREYWKDTWRYRELFLFLAWRDILVRYKQAIFGIGWAILRPVAFMAVFVFVFGYVAALPSDGVPYHMFVLVGMIPWQLFSSAVQDSSNSLVGSANLISKVYFPRLIIPMASIIVNLMDFLICLGLMILYLLVRGWSPGLYFLWLPAGIGLVLILCAGFGLWLSALNVRFRDFRFLVPFALQVGLYASPVGYSSSIVPSHLQAFYNLNPMVGVIEIFRYSFFGIQSPGFTEALLISAIWALVLVISGFLYFRKTERTFADVI